MIYKLKWTFLNSVSRTVGWALQLQRPWTRNCTRAPRSCSYRWRRWWRSCARRFWWTAPAWLAARRRRRRRWRRWRHSSRSTRWRGRRRHQLTHAGGKLNEAVMVLEDLLYFYFSLINDSFILLQVYSYRTSRSCSPLCPDDGVPPARRQDGLERRRRAEGPHHRRRLLAEGEHALTWWGTWLFVW